MVSVVAFVVIVTLLPSASVNVSVIASATTVLWPETAKDSKTFWLPPPASSAVQERFPAPSEARILPELEASLVGKVYVTPPSETVEPNVAAPSNEDTPVILSAVPEMPPATSSLVPGVEVPIPIASVEASRKKRALSVSPSIRTSL